MKKIFGSRKKWYHHSWDMVTEFCMWGQHRSLVCEIKCFWNISKIHSLPDVIWRISVFFSFFDGKSMRVKLERYLREFWGYDHDMKNYEELLLKGKLRMLIWCSSLSTCHIKNWDCVNPHVKNAKAKNEMEVEDSGYKSLLVPREPLGRPHWASTSFLFELRIFRHALYKC